MSDGARADRPRDWKRAATAILPVLLSCGCVTPMPEPMPEQRDRSLEGEASSGDGVLSLADARRAALRESPSLAASASSIRAEEARREQAGLWPNPELAVGLENVGGGGEFEGFDSSETTVALSQPLELGGKRRRRVDVAESSVTLSARDHALREREVAASVTSAFIEALAGQRRLELAEARFAAILGLVRRTQAAVAAGRVPHADLTLAQAELTRVDLARDRARSRLGVARVRLAALRGIEAPLPASLEGELDRVREPPELETLLEAVAAAPVVERWDQEVALQRANLRLERSRRVPDVEVVAGYRRLAGAQVNTAVFGLAVPLPLFDRNQGSIAAAGHEIERARSGRREARLRLRAELALAYEGLLSAFGEVETLNERVVPTAALLLDERQDAYRRGEVPLGWLLDAGRNLFEARAQLLTALERYHRAVGEVERLIDVDVGPEP
jgi:cobalt-zinc-cadmium efflux system outer membrane protein